MWKLNGLKRFQQLTVAHRWFLGSVGSLLGAPLPAVLDGALPMYAVDRGSAAATSALLTVIALIIAGVATVYLSRKVTHKIGHYRLKTCNVLLLGGIVLLLIVGAGQVWHSVLMQISTRIAGAIAVAESLEDRDRFARDTLVELRTENWRISKLYMQATEFLEQERATIPNSEALWNTVDRPPIRVGLFLTYVVLVVLFKVSLFITAAGLWLLRCPKPISRAETATIAMPI
jgi:hypothetical protein